MSAADTAFTTFYNAGVSVPRGLANLADNPVPSMVGGALVGGLYDQLRRKYYNTDEENENETKLQRVSRMAIPGLAAGIPRLAKGVFPNITNRHIVPQYRRYGDA